MHIICPVSSYLYPVCLSYAIFILFVPVDHYRSCWFAALYCMFMGLCVCKHVFLFSSLMCSYLFSAIGPILTDTHDVLIK